MESGILQELTVQVWAKAKCADCECVSRQRTFKVHRDVHAELARAFQTAYAAETKGAKTGKCRAIKVITGYPGYFRAKVTPTCQLRGIMDRMRRNAACCARCMSSHSIGIAIDMNPDENGQYYRNKKGQIPDNPSWADPARECYAFRESDAIVTALGSEGWGWGGKWRSKHDYMHFSKAE